MKNFLRSFRTTLAGAIFGGGILTDTLHTAMQTGKVDTHSLFGGLAIIVLGLLAKDAQVEGVAETK